MGSPALSDAIPSFGALIRAARLQRKITIDELAIQVDLSRAFLSRVEHGTNLPSYESIPLIADALRLNPAKLMLARLNAVMPEGYVVSDEHGNTFICRSGGAITRSPRIKRPHSAKY